MSKVNHIAVYGSLRKGQQASDLMSDLSLIGVIKIAHASLYALGWYPGLKFEENGEGVVAELYELPPVGTARDALMAALHRYEGYRPDNKEGSLFVPVTVTQDDLPPFYVYKYNHGVPENLIPVKNGNWVNKNAD